MSEKDWQDDTIDRLEKITETTTRIIDREREICQIMKPQNLGAWLLRACKLFAAAWKH